MEKNLENSTNKNFKSKIEKKKSDKKKYINLKLNNKLKLQQWEQRRQKNFQRKYNRTFKKHKVPLSQENIEKESASEGNERLSVFKAAQLEIKKRKEERKQLLIENNKKKMEMEQAIANYKKNKAEKFKKLSKKTKHGQPVMKDRMKLLFEEIKKKVSNENT